MTAGDEDTPEPAEKPTALGPISKTNEIMFRQIHPILYEAGVVASSAFMPTESVQGQLPVDRESLTTPKASFDLYRENGLARFANIVCEGPRCIAHRQKQTVRSWLISTLRATGHESPV